MQKYLGKCALGWRHASGIGFGLAVAVAVAPLTGACGGASSKPAPTAPIERKADVLASDEDCAGAARMITLRAEAENESMRDMGNVREAIKAATEASCKADAWTHEESRCAFGVAKLDDVEQCLGKEKLDAYKKALGDRIAASLGADPDPSVESAAPADDDATMSAPPPPAPGSAPPATKSKSKAAPKSSKPKDNATRTGDPCDGGE